MKNTLYTLGAALVVASLTLLHACNKSSSTGGTGLNNHVIPAEQMVTASLQGRVLDENGIPVLGATVTSGGASTTTDVNGVFSFSKISLSSRFGYVTANKSGYFTGSRSIITHAGASSFVSIQLVPRGSKGAVAAASGGYVVVGTGDTAAFAASSFVTAATNATYTGNVNVYAVYLDPTSPTFFKQMPGDLRGIGPDGTETTLQSYGMMDVELQDDAGAKLQLATGKKATLTWAIPDSLISNAPATMPMWYFSDSAGRWMQEGTAIRAGNSYVGQVAHFTYWNIAPYVPPVNFSVRLKDQFGNAVPYALVIIWYPLQHAIGDCGYTDSSGFAQGLLPYGSMTQMQILTECDYLLAGANVGPAIQDQNLGTVVVNLSETDLTLTGTVVDCSNAPVAYGFVNALVDGLNFRALVTNGAFTLPIHRCFTASTTAQFTAGDYTTLQQGATTTASVTTGHVDVGTLSACPSGGGGGSTNQFVTFSFNNQTYTINSPPDLVSYFSGAVTSYSNISHEAVQFDIPGINGTGNYTPTYFHMFTGAELVGLAGANQLTVTVTGFGPINQFITGTVSGNVLDSTTNAVYPMTGSFKLTREN